MNPALWLLLVSSFPGTAQAPAFQADAPPSWSQTAGPRPVFAGSYFGFPDVIRTGDLAAVSGLPTPATVAAETDRSPRPDYVYYVHSNANSPFSNRAADSFTVPTFAAKPAAATPTVAVPSLAAATTTTSSRTFAEQVVGLKPARPQLPVNAQGAAGGRAGKGNGRAGAVGTPGAEVMVFFNAGADGAAIAKSLGLTWSGPINADAGNIWILRAGDPAAAARASTSLSGLPGVQAAYQLTPNAVGKPRAFTPNDPFFFPGANPAVGGPGSTGDMQYPGQWHLVNNMPNGAGASGNVNTISVNIAGAWNNNFTGTGITIGIVEDAVQVAHPDLSPNAIAALHRYFSSTGANLGTNPNPPAASSIGDHGTAVAGVAAARGNNGIGGTGAAPTSGLVGIRTDDYNVTAVVAAYAHANGINGATSIQVKNHSYGPGSPFATGYAPTLTALQKSARAGAVNVIAIGNDRGDNFNEDGNKAYPQNSPHAVMIGALGNNGVFASYSSYGSNLIAVSPSLAVVTPVVGVNFPGITTTDRTGTDGYNIVGTGNYAAASGGGTGFSYTNDFGGTSSASPLAAGVIAVALSANPALLVGNVGTNQNTTRIIKHLLVRTSTIVDPTDSSLASDGGWRVNGAGRSFNQDYGFGLINATALTTQAPLFAGVTPLTTFNVSTTTVAATIPDNNPTGISRSFTVAVPALNLQPIEEVVVSLNISHSYRGDIRGYLTSPSGFRSRLFDEAGGDSGANIVWQFTTNAFWGENPNGTWTIELIDGANLDIGTWNSFAVEIRMGDLVPVPEPALLLAGGTVLLVLLRLRRRKSTVVG